MKAYVLINVRAGKSRAVVKKLRQLQGVKSANACWGRPDLFALVEAVNEKAPGRERPRPHPAHPRRRVHRHPHPHRLAPAPPPAPSRPGSVPPGGRFSACQRTNARELLRGLFFFVSGTDIPVCQAAKGRGPSISAL